MSTEQYWHGKVNAAGADRTEFASPIVAVQKPRIMLIVTLLYSDIKCVGQFEYLLQDRRIHRKCGQLTSFVPDLVFTDVVDRLLLVDLDRPRDKPSQSDRKSGTRSIILRRLDQDAHCSSATANLCAIR